jgi:hypothetical protein
VKTRNRYMRYCTHIWYEDWKCSECCQGDRCNYYVIVSKGSEVDLVLYRVSQEECAIIRESVPYVKLYRYNPKHLYPKLNGYGEKIAIEKWGLVTCPPTVAVRDAIHVHCA